MDIESQLEVIYNTAQTETAEGKICRDVLLSLWDDGTSHGCDLRGVLSLDADHYNAVQQVLHAFYNQKQQLDQFMTTRQITALDTISNEKPRVKGGALGVADTFTKVRSKH